MLQWLTADMRAVSYGGANAMRRLAIPPPSPIFAVGGRLVVVRGGGSARGCTIVTTRTPRNTEILPPSGPFREITRRWWRHLHAATRATAQGGEGRQALTTARSLMMSRRPRRPVRRFPFYPARRGATALWRSNQVLVPSLATTISIRLQSIAAGRFDPVRRAPTQFHPPRIQIHNSGRCRKSSRPRDRTR